MDGNFYTRGSSGHQCSGSTSIGGDYTHPRNTDTKTVTPTCTHRLKVEIKGNCRQTVISLEEMHTGSLEGTCSSSPVPFANCLSQLQQQNPAHVTEQHVTSQSFSGQCTPIVRKEGWEQGMPRWKSTC